MEILVNGQQLCYQGPVDSRGPVDHSLLGLEEASHDRAPPWHPAWDEGTQGLEGSPGKTGGWF